MSIWFNLSNQTYIPRSRMSLLRKVSTLVDPCVVARGRLRWLVASLLLTATASLSACGGHADGIEQADELPPPPLAFSSDGITLDTSTPEHAAGRFAREGSTIRFDLSLDRATYARHVVLTTDTGEPLFESMLRDGIDTSSYLGGKVKTTGQVLEEPQKEGDQGAFTELSAMPEAKLMPQLKEALAASGVNEELIRLKPSKPVEALKTTPKVYGAGGNTPYPDNVWRIIGSGQSVSFFSWGFWSTTAVGLASAADWSGGWAGASFVSPTGGEEYVGGYGEQRYYRQWWGGWITVLNRRIPLCSVYYPYECQDVRVWVLVK